MTSAGSPVTSTSPFPTSACRSFRRWSRASSGPTTGSTSWRSRCRHRATPATAARRRDRRRTRSAPGRGGSTSPERRPSCWSGIYGLKPTWGLVPYTGAFPIEASLDHLGPMARTTHDVALLLEIIAGPDGLDPRQHAGLGGGDYLGALGAGVEEVSIPWHRDAMPVWNAVALEGATAIMVAGESMAYGAKGRYATSLVDAFGAGRRDRGERLSETVKLTVLAGRWMAEAHHGRYYAKAQNLSRVAAAAYDSVLADHDLLVMPTLPLKATLIPAPDAPLEEQVARPVGMMLVGRHGDEPTILQAAHAFETEVWNPPPP